MGRWEGWMVKRNLTDQQRHILRILDSECWKSPINTRGLCLVINRSHRNPYNAYGYDKVHNILKRLEAHGLTQRQSQTQNGVRAAVWYTTVKGQDAAVKGYFHV